MSWEIFRCNLYTPTDDCTDKSTTKCISEALYQGQADAMVSEGFAAAGYASIHMVRRAPRASARFNALRAKTNMYAAPPPLRTIAGRRKIPPATPPRASCARTPSASPRA